MAEGLCYRLWSKGEEGALAAFPPAEIEAADLTGLALELALWGAEPGDLAFLTQPPEGAMAEACAKWCQTGIAGSPQLRAQRCVEYPGCASQATRAADTP